MPGCWQDWNGLEEVTEVTEGIGRNSHTLELQELGGSSHQMPTAPLIVLAPQQGESGVVGVFEARVRSMASWKFLGALK